MSFSVGLPRTVCSFVCDFIALEIMESVLTFHDDNFCKFHVLCACTGDACALEIRGRFVTERGKKRKPKFKPRPHCLGNKCNSKLSLTLFSPHPAHLTWFGPTLSCFVLLCSALDTIHSCISLSVLYLSQQYSFCTDYTCTWKPYVNLRQKLPLKNNIKWICDLKFGLQRKNNDVKTTMIISTVMIIDVFSIKTLLFSLNVL